MVSKSLQRLLRFHLILFILLLLTACDDDAISTASGQYTCDALPATDAVAQIVEAHQAVVDEIFQVNPGWIDLHIDSMTCPQGAYLIIYYETATDRRAILRILGDNTFFDVPCRLVNI